MLTKEPDRSILEEAIKKAFPDLKNALESLSPVWSNSLGCWTFTHNCIFYGVEPDGTVHT